MSATPLDAPRPDRPRAVPPADCRSPVCGWPVNEVILYTLVRSGQDTAQIATRYGVAPVEVDELLRVYGL